MNRLQRALVASVVPLTLIPLAIANVGHASSAPTASPQQVAHPTVRNEVHHDTSAPLRDMHADPNTVTRSYGVHRASTSTGARAASSAPNSAADTSGQSTAASPHIPSTNASFTGIGNLDGVLPPDSNGAVGPTQYMELINSHLAVYSKTGATLLAPETTNTLWSGFGGSCQTNNDGDGMVIYDAMAGRWVAQQFSVTTTPYMECVAVSTSNDATGTWNRYAFSTPGTDFPDYPKMAVWPDAYYITYNMFNAAGTAGTGSQACAYNRASMIAGTAAAQQCVLVSASHAAPLDDDTTLAASVEGSTAPPAGSPEYLLSAPQVVGSQSTLHTWSYHIDWNNPANSTLSAMTSLNVSAYTMPCFDATSGGIRDCVPQTGTQKLDAVADRLMSRLSYRNLGSRESLVVDESIVAGSSIGMRWYELAPVSGRLSVSQQGTVAPDSNYRWMGSVSEDKSGDIAMGYSLSSASTAPQIRYTGRLVNDPAGTMPQGEGNIALSGSGSQTIGNRWGDYTSMTVDPSDDCTFWYVNEHGITTGDWTTHIASFTFPSCGGTVTNDFSISANPTSLTLAQGAGGSSTISTAVTSGSAGTVSLSVSGTPSGATASVSPTSVTAGGSSTLSVNAGTAAAGTYTLTVTGTEGSATHATSVSLTVTGGGGGGGALTNGGFETGSLSGWTSSGSTSVVNSGAHSGTYAARVGATTPTTDSSISQTFTIPSGGTALSFWYNNFCPDTITYDWASATLKDNTTNTTTTVLPNTCNNPSSGWTQKTASVTAGHSVTLTLSNHDDNYAGDPTYTLYDDVTVSGTAPPVNDFGISANPTSLSLVQGTNGSSTISTSVTSGSAATVSLSVAGTPSGASASLNPTSVTAGGGSTLSVGAGTAAAGTYTLTVTGVEGSKTHSATVSLTVTSSGGGGGGLTNGGFETGTLAGWTSTGSTSVVSSGAQSGTYAARVGATTPTTDSSISQTFTVPSGGTTLSFYYNIFCPDSITYDWASATLKDNTTNTTTTVLPNTCTNPTSGWTQKTASVTAGHSVTLTLSNHDDNYSGDPTYTLYDSVTVSGSAPPPNPVVNGGFETGSLSGWTAAGASEQVTTSAHTGSYSAYLGLTTATNGDSSIAQAISVPASASTLTFWYANHCTDTVTYDWATMEIRNTSGTTLATPLAHTCSSTYTWTQVTYNVTAYRGQTIVLWLANHDDNYSGDPTYTLFDDVSMS